MEELVYIYIAWYSLTYRNLQLLEGGQYLVEIEVEGKY